MECKRCGAEMRFWQSREPEFDDENSVTRDEEYYCSNENCEGWDDYPVTITVAGSVIWDD